MRGIAAGAAFASVLACWAPSANAAATDEQKSFARDIVARNAQPIAEIGDSISYLHLTPRFN